MEILHKTKNKTIYREGNLVVKLFDESYPKADILNEALNQARVEETDLKIPKIVEVTDIGGKWAIKREFIAGSTLAELMEEHPEKEDEYLERFVALQMEVNSKKVPLLSRLRDKMHAKISASGFPQSVRYDLHMRLDGLPRHIKLCHGDFCPNNILITPKDEAYIIDWAHATQGNASADTARAYLTFKLQGKDELAEKYLALYCKKTGTAIQYVQNILPIVAASQSVKGNPEEQEFLAKWVNVVDWQ